MKNKKESQLINSFRKCLMQMSTTLGTCLCFGSVKIENYHQKYKSKSNNLWILSRKFFLERLLKSKLEGFLNYIVIPLQMAKKKMKLLGQYQSNLWDLTTINSTRVKLKSSILSVKKLSNKDIYGSRIILKILMKVTLT